MNIFTPTSAYTPSYSFDRENGGVLMNRFTSSFPDASPFYCFPGLTGQMFRDLTASGGVDAEVVALALTAVMSLLTKGSAYVVWPNGQDLSVGANVSLLTPFLSGNGTILQTLMRPIEQDLAMRISANGGGQHDGFLIGREETYEGVVRNLHKYSTAGYFNDQPGQFKRMLKNASKWDKLLDGTLLRSARGSCESIQPNLTIFSMDEPDLSNAKMLKSALKKDGAAVINRFFLAWLPDSRVEGPIHRIGLSAAAAKEYEKKVNKCLDVRFKQINPGHYERSKLMLSHHAAEFLDHTNQEVRSNCAPGARWASNAGYAMGHMERISRFAGSIHVFEHLAEGEISLDTLQCADAIGKWCVDSVARAVYEPPKLTRDEIDAAALEKGLISLYFSEARKEFLISDIRTFALGLGLMPARFNRALAVLGKQGKVRIFPHLNKPWLEILCVPEFSRTPSYLRTVHGSFA